MTRGERKEAARYHHHFRGGWRPGPGVGGVEVVSRRRKPTAITGNVGTFLAEQFDSDEEKLAVR